MSKLLKPDKVNNIIHFKENMVKRYSKNPILTRADIPAIRPHLVDVSSVFNPGAIRIGNRYLLMLRVQNRGRETFLLRAESGDGINFQVVPEVVKFSGIEKISETIYHIYDARLTQIGDSVFIMFAMDLESGCHLGLAQTSDFARFEFLGITTKDDTRNGVLFPEKIGGRYLRLDRPNKVQLQGGPTSGNTIYLAESDDLIHWSSIQPIMSGRWHYWDELIGSGPPPVKTRSGWLHVYHGVATHFGSANIYQAGVMLLDLLDPTRLLGRSRYNILEPREPYELAGQVPNVVFPSGMIVETFDADGFAAPDSPVYLYYGAADTCVGLAMTTIQNLIQACSGENHII